MTYSNPFAGLSSFFRPGDINDPRVNAQLRQKIALAMLAQKRPYPKTFGEGLAAIGDALGERRTASQLEELDKLQQLEANKPAPTSDYTPASQKMAYAADTPVETAPPAAAATQVEPVLPRAAAPAAPAVAGLPPRQPGDMPVLDPSTYNELDQAANLREQRAPYMAQLNANPAQKLLTAATMRAESGPGAANSAARMAIAESMFNRGASRGYDDFGRVLDPRYYEPMHSPRNNISGHIAALQRNPAELAALQAEIDKVGGEGTNVSNLATDNASGKVARNSMGNQTLTWQTPNGESYFRKDVRPDVHGPGNVASTQDWMRKTALDDPAAIISQRANATGAPPVMAFDGPGGNALPPEIAQGFSATPGGPQIPPAPQQQRIAQAPTPGYVRPERELPKAPAMIDPSPRERQLEQYLQANINNPYMANSPAAKELQQLQAARAYEQARRTDAFNKDYAAGEKYNEERQKELGLQQERTDKASEEAYKAGQRKRFGPLDPKDVYADTMKSRENAVASREALIAAEDAVKAIKNGAITGIGANAKLDWNKFLGAWGLSAKGSEVENTEVFKSRIAILMGPLRRALLSGQTSDPDREFLLNASGGNISMEPGSIKRVVEGLARASRNIVDTHNKDVDLYYGDDAKARQRLAVDVPKEVTIGSRSAEEQQAKDDAALNWALTEAKPGDPRAIDIARANPSDPRSKKILQGIRR